MEINENTKLTDIMEAYPQLLDQLISLDSRFGLLKTPFGRMAIRGKTMKDASEKYNVPMDQLKQLLSEQLARLS